MRYTANKTCIAALTWMLAFTATAQQKATNAHSGQIVNEYLRQAGDYASLYTGRLLTTNKLTGWYQHPYWEDEVFHAGTVCYGGTLYPDVQLRYDVFRHELEVKTPVGQHVVLPEHDKVQYFTMESMTFVPREEGYAYLLFDGANIELRHARSKRRGFDKIVNGNMSIKDFETTNTTYIYYQEKEYPVRKLKDVTKIFPDYKNELTSFCRKKDLSFNKEESTASMLQLSIYLDDLLSKAGVQSTQQKQTGAEAIRIAPDSLFTAGEMNEKPTSSPSFRAFHQDAKNTVIAYEDKEEPTTGTAGISSLKALKEERILDEVEIVAFQSKLSSVQTGLEKFRPQQLRNMPMSMGESDVMKMVLSLPGVSSVGEASSGINVRGGSSDQNLVMLGGNTVFNTMHLFGLFSAFNTDFISDVALYKSGIPAQYGGRISSVMELTPHLADRKRASGSATIGILTSKANVDVPIVKDRLCLSLAGRTTYSDWILKLLPENSDYNDGKAQFHDLNGSLSFVANRRHYINLYGYYSYDRFSFSATDRHSYTNTNGSLEWKGYWNDRLSSIVQAGWDRYGYKQRNTESPFEASLLSYDIQQYFLRSTFSLQHGNRNQLKFGATALQYVVHPGRLEPAAEISNIAYDELATQKAIEAAIFAEEEYHPNERWMITGGLRATLYKTSEEGKEKTYLHPEARLSASYKLNETMSLKAGLNTMHQYLQKLSNTVIMSPTDTWRLSNSLIKPQNGGQISFGYFWEMTNHKFEASAEVYYKQMNNYLTYKNAAQLTMNHELEADVFGAEGRAFGLELQVKKPTGRLNGWISYTLSRSQLRQPKGSGALLINDGKWFPSDYDRPHELNIVANYRFTRRISISVNMDYSTGRPTTVPVGMYYDRNQRSFLPLYSNRNSYRIPDYFRTDVSFNIDPSHHLTAFIHSHFTIGCYNVTGRRNAYNIYYVPMSDRIQGKRISIFGAPIPFISYTIKFN